MDVDGRIRRYWQRKELMLSDEDSKRRDELAASLEFRDASAGTPVPAIEAMCAFAMSEAAGLKISWR